MILERKAKEESETRTENRFITKKHTHRVDTSEEIGDEEDQAAWRGSDDPESSSGSS